MVKSKSHSKTHSDKFPLTLHPTGRFCKKIRGKLYYFSIDKQHALPQYPEQAAYLHTGKAPKPKASQDCLSIKISCNLYVQLCLGQRSHRQCSKIESSKEGNASKTGKTHFYSVPNSKDASKCESSDPRRRGCVTWKSRRAGSGSGCQPSSSYDICYLYYWRNCVGDDLIYQASGFGGGIQVDIIPKRLVKPRSTDQ